MDLHVLQSDEVAAELEMRGRIMPRLEAIFKRIREQFSKPNRIGAETDVGAGIHR